MKNTLIPLARKLRKDSTDAERLLWRHLRRHYLGGLHFRRQEPIGKFIVDFLCEEKKVVVELDGLHHGEPEHEEYDEKRTAFLNELGYRVLRFSNNDVLNNTMTVLENISEICFKGTISEWR